MNKTDRAPPPYTVEEAEEARLWVDRHGPSNSWTASNGTAARMIGRLLQERVRLLAEVASLRQDANGSNALTPIETQDNIQQSKPLGE